MSGERSLDDWLSGKWLIALALTGIIFSLWAWAPALAVGFLADDYEWFSIVRNLESQEVWRLFWPRSITPVRALYRPFVGLLFWADWRVWGLEPHGYHLRNLLWHAVSVAGVFFLASSLWKVIRRRDGITAGLFAASWFAVNPLLPEAVTWIDGRYDVLASALLLWSLVSLVGWLQEGRRSGWWFGLSLVLVWFSLLAKEIGLVYPFLVGVILIYRYVDSNTLYIIDIVNRVFRDQGRKLLWVAGVVIGYLVISTAALGRPFWQVSGYSRGISRPFLLWLTLTFLWWFAQRLRKDTSFGRGWLAWIFIGLSLLPVVLFPTQLRFLYLPSALAAIWLAAVIPDLLKRVGLQRALLPIWFMAMAASAIVLRLENLEWLRASRLQQQTVAAIRSRLTEVKPQIVFVFNLADHAGRVPLFRSYVAEAVLLGYRGRWQPGQVQVIAGPRTVDLGKSTLSVVDPSTIEVTSTGGFMVFEPAVRQRFPDGSVEIAGEQWWATVSPDRERATVRLGRPLDAQGVLGLVYEGGAIQSISLD